MANIYKSLSPFDYSIIPFPAYYKYSYTYQSGSISNSPDIQLSYGEKFLTSSNVTRLPNATYELFDSVIQSFYSPVPYAAYGTTATSYIPSASVYAISIAQSVFGEKVLPGSFSVQLGTSQSYDDGKGNIIVSSSGTGGIVGRIFYDKGMVLLKPTASIAGGGLTNNGIFIANGTNLTIQFSSSIMLYENTWKAKLEPTEFLVTNNPSAKNIITGSTDTGIALMVSGSLLPYVTTIGFYNDDNELLLVAKPSVPIQRTTDVAQTFIVKFDI